jgi:hypothetical protein
MGGLDALLPLLLHTPAGHGVCPHHFDRFICGQHTQPCCTDNLSWMKAPLDETSQRITAHGEVEIGKPICMHNVGTQVLPEQDDP